jgi:regulator of sirC expression with transglutaminase-like and TPR domain
MSGESMDKESKIPFLLNLVDDEDYEIRKNILKELSAYGDDLEEKLLAYSNFLSPSKIEVLTPLFEEKRRNKLIDNWKLWFSEPEDAKQLEMAMDMIARYQLGASYPSKLPELLDEFSAEFKEKYSNGNEIDLANFLFKEKELQGEKKDYYNPFNSNLVYVLETKKGLPISLAIIYILIGRRLGLNVEGCNFPGHFLAKTYIENELALIDGFNGGRIIFEKDIQVMVEDSQGVIMNIIKTKTPASLIIRRTLNNLIYAYQAKSDKINSDFFSVLQHQII